MYDEYDYEADYQAAMGYLGLYFVIMLILSALMWWRVFTKAKYSGWLSLIPILNIYILCKIGGKRGYWAVLFFIPIINIVVLIWLWNMISKSFGKDEGFTIGLVLLPFIFFPILGFSHMQYLGPYGNKELFDAYTGKHRFEFEEQANP